MPFETRASKRHALEATASFSLHQTMAGTMKLNIPTALVKAGLMDISAGGCGLDSPYLIPPDITLKIDIDAAPFADELKKEHPQPISVTGVVRSSVMKSAGHYRLGIQFTEIAKEEADFINEFVHSKEKRQTPRWDMSH